MTRFSQLTFNISNLLISTSIICCGFKKDKIIMELWEIIMELIPYALVIC